VRGFAVGNFSGERMATPTSAASQADCQGLARYAQPIVKGARPAARAQNRRTAMRTGWLLGGIAAVVAVYYFASPYLTGTR